MAEYIVNIPDDKANEFISRFGIDSVRLLGFSLNGEFIRCIDCKYLWPLTYYCCVCTKYKDKLMPFVELDDFCSKAERRDANA